MEVVGSNPAVPTIESITYIEKAKKLQPTSSGSSDGAPLSCNRRNGKPENVGFAIQWAQVRAFLEIEGVNPSRASSDSALPSSDVARIAKQITVAVECTQ